MNFFITGNSAVSNGLDLNLIAPVNARARNFASKGQTLQASYSIAQNIFRRTDKDKINFVLIGLTVDVLFLDETENLTADVFNKNLQALNEFLKLCHENDAQPVAVIFPVAPGIRESYTENFFRLFMDILEKLANLYKLKVLSFFNSEIPVDFFSDETHLNEYGATKLSVALTLELFKSKIFSKEDFSNMSYDYFYHLSYMIDKNSFHSLLEQIYFLSLEKILRKKKIKVAFVTDHAACWCGDKLYNLFAQNSRFETTAFLTNGSESTVADTWHDFEQLKSAGINVVAVLDLEEKTPPQDIIFFLRPYLEHFPNNFQYNVLTPQTLLIYIPYYISTVPGTLPNYYTLPIFRLAWKYFFETESARKVFDDNCEVGTLCPVVSGVPKLDLFFEDASKTSFAWKMTHSDAVKIIWAPHHSFIGKTIEYAHATFQYNYKFLYEFAKAHPETSWVVKPHPRLKLMTVLTKLFPSSEAYEEYLQAWNDLPNAQVFTGGYYQEIFATSDGMIHDSISFIAEYQFVDKPMIYLLNNEQEEFSELGKKILDVSYVVDGKNLEQIDDALQKIFIEGNDPLQTARQKVFDAELNYYRKNGMTASDFIYKTVVQELEMT